MAAFILELKRDFFFFFFVFLILGERLRVGSEGIEAEMALQFPGNIK